MMAMYKSGCCCCLLSKDEERTLNGQVRMPWIRYSVEYDSIVYMEEDQAGWRWWCIEGVMVLASHRSSEEREAAEEEEQEGRPESLNEYSKDTISPSSVLRSIFYVYLIHLQ